MTSEYTAPYGIATRPFSPPAFPGSPPFGTPAPVAPFPPTSFRVTNGPPNMGPTSIPDFAVGVMRPNRVTDQITNGQIVYNYICITASGDPNRLADIGVGSLCLARITDARNSRDSTMQRAKKARTQTSSRPELCVDVFELTQLNYFLWQDAVLALHARSEFHGFAGDKNSPAVPPLDAQGVRKQFAMLGVVLNEPASVDSRDRMIRNMTRAINFVAGGRCNTFNLWNSGRLGTSLWLVLKKRRIVRGSQMAWAWQFVPEITENGRRPTIAQLRSETQDGGESTNHELAPLGVALFVGTLGHTSGDVALDPSKLLAEQALFHLNAKPVVEVFLNI